MQYGQNRCNCGNPGLVNGQAPCKCEPIILQPKTCVINKYYPIEQPVICPTHTRVINNYVPVPRFYPQHTTSEEICCSGGSTPTYNTNSNERV